MAMFSTQKAPGKAAKRLGLKRSAAAVGEALVAPVQKVKTTLKTKVDPVDETRAIAKHYLKKYDKTFRNLAK